jgi:hypothetical protein
MEAERSVPSAVGEISDCDKDSQVGFVWSTIGLFVLGLLSRTSMLQRNKRVALQVPLSSILA